MKKIIFLAILIGIGIFFCGHSNYQKAADTSLAKLEDLNSNSFRLGLPLGAQSMHVGEAKFTKSRPCYFNSHHSAYSALIQGKIDGYLFDSHTLDYVAASSPDYTVLPGSAGKVDIAVGLPPKNAELLGPINQFIAQYKKDGTYDAMYTRWISPPTKTADGFDAIEIPPMPQIDAPAAPTRTLVVGVCSQLEPLCFRPAGSEELTGFDMELLRRLALHLNVRFVIRDMDYITMMGDLASGKLDIVVAGLNKTEERIKRKIIFTDNYIDSRIVALVRATQVTRPTPEQ